MNGTTFISHILLNRMVCRKKKEGGKRCARRKKVIRKDGKRYYRAGKSGLVRLKGAKKAPRIRR
jgi:hypothetical protein